MQNDMTVTQSLPGFIEYAVAERSFRPKTIRGYTECIRFFVKQVGDVALRDISLTHFISLKARLHERACGESRVSSIINATKCLLGYARDILGIPVMDLSSVSCPRLPRRQVQYLTVDELESFIAAIPLRTWAGKPRLTGYCFRALVETLVATGMRISEALALNRNSIH